MANKTQLDELQITFAAKNAEMGEGLKAYATKKLGKLLKHFHRINSIEIVYGLQRNWHSIEVTVHGDGIVLRAQERASDAQGAMDEVLDKVERQLHRYREKLIDRSRQQAEPAPEGAAPAAEAAQEPEAEAAPAGPAPQIVRTKRFALKPMTPEEAAMQMDVLAHDFFVFANSETEQVNVLYRRKDGNYGLIEPEV
jgi:putative sigma-54 modulation protein